MAEMLHIKGILKLKERLASDQAGTLRRLATGLHKAGFLLQRCSQEIVPVDTSTLKNSAFTTPPSGPAVAPEVRVGYTANYALYVHENMEARHKPGKVAKFLESPAREKQPELRAVVLAEMNKGK